MTLAVEKADGRNIKGDINRHRPGHMSARGGTGHVVSEEKRKVGGAFNGSTAEGRPEKRARAASESEGVPNRTTVTNKDGDEPPAPQPTRSSSRVPKRPRRDMSPPPSPPKKTAGSTSGKEKDGKAGPSSDGKTGTPEAKSRRQWEGWSTEDINTFFEALLEHGRDFDAIHNMFSQKHSRRGDSSLIKTKDQIRHFYYRTWHKISKYIDGVDDVNKHAFELYGLINYGEIRRRTGSKLEKIGQKLNELIHKGSTSVKGKGRNYHHRIKTPTCPALRKLNNNVEEPKEQQIQVPDAVTVEMIPHTNAAWARVQGMAQNPLLRVKLKPSKRLSDIIEFLNKKWKPHRLRLKENLHAAEESTEEIKVFLPSDAKLNPYELAPAPSQRVDITLESYKEMVKNYEESTGHSPSGKRGNSRHVNKISTEPVEPLDDCAQSAEDVQDKLHKSVVASSLADTAIVNSVNKKVGASEQCATGKVIAMETSEAVVAALNTVGAKENKSKSKSKDVCETQLVDSKQVSGVGKDAGNIKENGGIECKKEGSSNMSHPGNLQKTPQEKLEHYRKGLNHKAASEVTFAELYLTLGGPEKLVVEYEWCDIKPAPNILPSYENLTNSLRRLLHLAVTEFSDFNHSRGPRNVHLAGLSTTSPPRKCICGANQSGTPPSGKTAGRSPRVGQGPATPKTVKPATAAAPKTPVSRKSADSATAKVGEEAGTSVNQSVQPASVPASSADVVFRVPTSVPLRPGQAFRISPNSLADRNLLQQINQTKRQEILLPRRNKKLSRCVRRPLVVQKTLLPKTQIQDCQIMTLAMLPNGQVAQTGSFMPILPHSSAGLVPGAQQIAMGTMAGQSPLAQQMAAMATKTRRPQNIVARAAAATLGPDIMGAAASSASNDGTANMAGITLNGTPSAVPVQLQMPAVSSSAINSLPVDSSNPILSASSLFNLNTSVLQQAGKSVSGLISTTQPGSVVIGSVGQDTVGGVSIPTGTVVPSPSHSMSALLDMSLPAASETTSNENGDKLIDIALGNSLGLSNSSFSGLLDSSSNKANDSDPSLATPVLNSEISLDGSLMTSNLSPNKSSRAGSLTEVQWLNGEEFSLSQFLTESPSKKNDSSTINNTSVPPTHILSESSRDSTILGRYDLDTNLQCLMNENSMDYVAKFADLAAQVAASAPQESLRKADRLGAD